MLAYFLQEVVYVGLVLQEGKKYMKNNKDQESIQAKLSPISKIIIG